MKYDFAEGSFKNIQMPHITCLPNLEEVEKYTKLNKKHGRGSNLTPGFV